MSESQSLEVPPRPEEILDEDRIAYQAMSDLSDEKYADLAADIRERGVLDTILIDENDTILDGHHREAITKHYDLSDRKAPSYLRLSDLDDNDEKLARAIKMNLLGRDTDQGVKADAVEQYITRAWATDDETGALVRTETNVEVGDALGVDNSLVGRVVKDLQSQIIYHDRVKAREYYRDNPDASYRDVAEQVEASRPTVTEWLKADFDEGEEEDNDDTEQQPLNMLARNQSEVEQTRELANRARDEDEDDDVSEVAQDEAEKVASGETTPDRAFETVEDEQENNESESESGDGTDEDTNDSDGDDIEQFTSQQTDEWSSPPDVVRPLDEAIGGFDLDPCSGAEQSPFADETYTEDDDGLAQEWFGSVWVNPPYSDMSSWVDKATAEAVCDGVETVVFLCKGDSSTQWWQTAAADATLITAIDGRLSFGDGENSAPFPSHIVVFGSVNEALVDALGEQGTNLTVGWDDEQRDTCQMG